MPISGGFARPLRRLSILVDVQDQATAQLAAMNGAAMKTSRLFSDTAKTGSNMNAALIGTAAVAGLGTIAINRLTRAGAQLDRTFAVIEATANATDEEMQQIISTTQEIGRDMPVTMDQVASAFEQFSYAGFEAREAVEASRSAVELAVAGSMDMARAVETTTQIMNAFNIEAMDAHTITTQLAATFASSAIEIDEIGSAMAYVAGTADQLGLSLTETTAAIGALADQGLQGTMAGTALNQALSSLAGQQDRVQNAMQAVGFEMEEFMDEEGNMKSMVEVFGMMDERLGQLGITGMGRARFLEDMFGRRGARAAGRLLDDIEAIEEKMETGARAQILEAIDDMEEMDEITEAKREIMLGVGADDLEFAREQLEDMDDEEILEWAEAFDDIPVADDPMEFVEDMRAAVDEGMGEEELIHKLHTIFGLERDAARVIAEDIMSDRPLEDIEEDFDEAVGAADITAAQMETVGGMFEYIRGSIQSLMYTMYTGFRPAIRAILRALIAFLDVLGNNQRALQAFGMILFTVTTLTAGYVAKTMLLWSAKKALAGATWLANTALITKAATLIVVKANALLAMYSMFGLSGALFYIAGAAVTGAKAMAAFAAATLAANWPLLVIIGALVLIMGVIYAVQNNIFGLGDAWNWLTGLVGGGAARIYGWLDKWLISPLQWLGGVFMRLIGWVQTFFDWFADLPAIGQLFLAALFPPVGAALLLYSAMVNLSDIVGAVVGQVRRLVDWYNNLGTAGQWLVRILVPKIMLLEALIWLFRTLSSASSGFFNWLYEGGTTIARTFEDGMERVESAASSVATILEWIFGDEGTDADDAVGAFEDLADSVESFVDPIGTAKDLLDGFLDIIGRFTIGRDIDLDALINAFWAIGEVTDGVVDDLSKWIRRLSPIIDMLWEVAEILGLIDDEEADVDVEGDGEERGGPGPGPGGPHSVDDVGRAAATTERLGQAMTMLGGLARGPSPVAAMTAQPVGASQARKTQVGGSREVYNDNRTVAFRQDPTFDIDAHRGGPSASNVQRQVERAMEETRSQSMQDFIDFLTLGGPGGPDGAGDPTDPADPTAPLPPEDWEAMSPGERESWLEENDQLPSDWDEMDEDEQQSYLEDLEEDDLDVADPDETDVGEDPTTPGDDEQTDGEDDDATTDGNDDDGVFL